MRVHFLLWIGILAACNEDPASEALLGEEAEEVAPVDAPSEVRRPGWSELDVVDYRREPMSRLGTAEREGMPLTRDELAQALRPVLSTPLGTKVARQPNWAGADAILRSGQQVLAYDPGKVSQEPPARTSVVLGGDGRTRVTNTTI